MEHQKYSTSKSKTFDKETYIGDIAEWLDRNIDTVSTNSDLTTDPIFKTKQKYKITIVNLNE